MISHLSGADFADHLAMTPSREAEAHAQS